MEPTINELRLKFKPQLKCLRSLFKDDANFKLMSERIKSNQISRLSREEKEMLTQQVATLSTQVEKAVNSVFKYRAALWAARAICT